MKRAILLIILLVSLTIRSIEAQESNYIRVSLDAGLIANSSYDKKFGLGGTIGWLTQDNMLSFNPNNYLSLSIKAFNNPYGEGKFFSSINNDANDGFTYIMPLLGYRFTREGIANGFFIEPRLGMVFGSGYYGFALSPIAGYAVQQFNFSLYCDMGIGGAASAILKKSFFTPGISVAYNFSLN